MYEQNSLTFCHCVTYGWKYCENRPPGTLNKENHCIRVIDTFLSWNMDRHLKELHV